MSKKDENRGWDSEDDISLEELFGDTDDEYGDMDYEEDYVYGDSEDLDYGKLGYDDEYEEVEQGDLYGNPQQEKQVKGRFSHLIEEEEEVEEEEEKLTFEERVSNFTTKALDFFDSKRFNNLQWMLALGGLMVVGIVIVLITQAGSNLDSNVSQLEGGGAKYVAQEVAPEEFSLQKEYAEEIEQQQVELENYIGERTKAYDEQVQELGELPEGYVESMDADGNLTYVSEEELYGWEEGSVRENTEHIEERDIAEVSAEVDIDIVPSNEEIWYAIRGYTDDLLAETDVYQTKGQLIYFMQRALPITYSYQILESYMDTDTMVLHVTLNSDRPQELPDNFEERMNYAYQHSGYQVEQPDALTFSYTEKSLDDFLAEQ